MYCPKCGVKNLEDAKFCRACGADVRLVPQALAGSLPEPPEQKKKESKPKEPPTLEKGFENIFGGIACLVIFVLGLTSFQSYFWISVWFIIPGLEHIGKGVGQVIRSRREPRALPAPHADDALPAVANGLLPGARLDAPHGPATSEIPPPSVTESTTRSLGSNAPRAARGAR